MPAFHQFLLFVLILPSMLHAQEDKEELVEWSAGRKLSWLDYKADPDRNSDAAASTTTYLAIQYNIRYNGFTYKINSKFSKDRSWGLHKTNYILSHEQGHFDLAEVFARKLHMRMTEYQFNAKTAQKDLKKIYQEVTSEKEKVQNDYDKETKHSINKSKQAEWLERIDSMLKDYEQYANY